MSEERQSSLDGTKESDHKGHGCSFDPGPDLDGAQMEAVYSLALFVANMVHTDPKLYQGNELLEDCARQYVTAQARYTNMLRDWEQGK